jgi:autotransporter-associated beta strand protein
MNTQSKVNSINPGSRLHRRLPFCRPATRDGFAAALLALTFVLCLAGPAAHASLLAYEGFAYSAGSANLTGLNSGFGWGSPWYTINNGSSSVSGGSLTAGANAPAGYDALSAGNSAFTPNGTRTSRWLDRSAGGTFGSHGYINGNGHIGADGKTLYVSFMQQPNGTAVYYEFEFHRGDLGDPGRMAGVGNDAGDNDVHFRIEDPPGGGSSFTDLGAGNTSVNFYVVRFDFNYGGGNTVVTIYRNPTSATEPLTPTAQITGITADMSFDGIALGAFANGITVAHDEVRLGETWSDVTVNPGSYSSGTWDGGGADNNWSTAGNWSGDLVPPFASPLTFAGSTRLNNTNDLTGVAASSITFDSAAGAFALNGNSLGLNGNIAYNANPASLITQTINLPLTATANFNIDTRTNGNITLNGNVTSGVTVTQTSPGNAGVLTLAGTNTFSGFLVNGGTNIITGNTTVNLNNTRFALANANTGYNATLIIQNGANFTVNGNGVDAGVIGRDGGVGKVIQNGGTFSFNIPNNNKLFIVATGNAAGGQGSYNMNGGLFDMNNNILSPGLGANGVVITGYVNQVAGVITNVGQLVPGWNAGQNGRGVYNLTGGAMYITGISGVGITSQSGKYDLNLGGGTMAAEASWSSALNMNLTGINGPVTFNPSGYVITLTGVLSGSGGLTVNGAGVLELSGANTYTGDTTVSSGSTLQLDATGSSPSSFHVANGGLLNLNYAGTYAVGSFYTNGVPLQTGTYNAGNLPGFITGGGNLQVTSGISTGLWDGGGSDNNWSTAANWDHDAVPVFPHALTFAGSTRLNNNNDLGAITIGSLTFDSAAGAFTLGGNDATLSGAVGFNANPAAPVTQTVNLNLTFTGNQTIDLPANGNLTLGGNITSGNALTKSGSGVLTLAGANDSFSSFYLDGGSNVIAGTVNVTGTGGGRIYIGDIGTTGTLVLQPGANLSVSGGFADACVLGRDSGSGYVIQNGGTFTYNPTGPTYMFVGASSSAATRAEYHMNGGTLDMSGYSLGVGLSANGSTLITGVVNQVSGNIINLFKLDLGALTYGPGRGIYSMSGGSISIGLGGITSDSGIYEIYLGGGTVGANDFWSSSLNMTLTGSNGPVTFDTAGYTIQLSGVLSGPGGLNVAGGGILELSGANSYLGDSTVTSGVLQLDVAGSSAGSFRVVDGGLLNLNYSGNFYVSHLYTNGVAVANGTYNSGNLPAYITGTGNLVVSAISTGTWDGGGADNNWSTAANWDNDANPIFPIGLTFDGSLRLNNTNDLTVTANSITFSSTAGAFTLNGNNLGLSGNIGFSGNPASPITQAINLPLTMTANVNVATPANGNISIGGDITAANNALLKVDVGTLTLGGNNNVAALEADGGTNIITGTTTVTGTGGSRIYVANGDYVGGNVGTLIIPNGATFSIGGSLADAFVVGRDTGVGRLIQNGGTFNYNPNQAWIFIGAGNNPSTRGQYDMNGGVLDMNGKNLGLGLGVGVAVTGIVNQASGVITNVGQLYLNPIFNSGYGFYNLTGGSIYIGSGGIAYNSGGGYQLNLGGGTVGATASWSSPLDLSLTGINGATTFSPNGNNITLSGILSGAGGLTVSGAGTLELSGANTYTGDTTVGAGTTLKLDSTSNSSGAFHVAGGATLSLNYIGTLVVTSLYTNGVAVSPGTYTSANLPAFITGTGSLTIPAAAAGTVNPPVSSGGNLILTGSGWTPSAGYVWLVTTNLTPPVVWTTNTTGNFDGSGNFSNAIPVSASTPAAFFRLRTP